MESPPHRQIFRLYWRTFLPFWLLPIPATALTLFVHFATERTARLVMPYLFGAVFIYLVVTQLRPVALWRRQQITYWEMQLLSAQVAAVGIVCIVIAMFILSSING
jgi:hypothetical protein